LVVGLGKFDGGRVTAGVGILRRVV
jgi:hypothetical protein